MTPSQYFDRTCIIVVEIEDGQGRVMTGILVDAVSEVLQIKTEDVDPRPAFGTSLDTDYILGTAKMGGGVKILFDIDRVIKGEELSLLRDVA